MGRHDPNSKSKPAIVVDEAVHTRLRVLSAEKNVTLKAVVAELLAFYEARIPQEQANP